MGRERLARIVALFAGGDGPKTIGRLCRACTTEFEVSGAAVSIVVGGQLRRTLGASDERVAKVAELEFVLGEGPCLEVYDSGRPVLEPCLAGSSRWPLFGPEAVTAGIRAVFSVPLRIGAGRFGAFCLYNETAGALRAGVLADAMVVAEVSAAAIGEQAQGAPDSLSELWEGLADHHATVHQATGIISVQLDVTLGEALVALRARAYADGSGVATVAANLIAHRVRFDPDP